MAEEVKHRILVTGGGGFIGSHTAKRLKEQGHFVRICDWKRNEFWADNEICRMSSFDASFLVIND